MRTKKTADLPDLQEQGNANHEIVADNIRAVQSIYSAALLEELKAFQVIDRLVELFQQGGLPIGRGRAGRYLFKYWKESASRLSELDQGVCTREFLVFREARQKSFRIESSIFSGFGLFQALRI